MQGRLRRGETREHGKLEEEEEEEDERWLQHLLSGTRSFLVRCSGKKGGCSCRHRRHFALFVCSFLPLSLSVLYFLGHVPVLFAHLVLVDVPRQVLGCCFPTVVGRWAYPEAF